MMQIEYVLIAIPLIAVLTFATRALPFVFFNRRKPPKTVVFLEKYIPPMVMTILVIYCLKDTALSAPPYGLNEALPLVLVVAVHLLLKNPLISIFGGTVLYMFLVQSSLLLSFFR